MADSIFALSFTTDEINGVPFTKETLFLVLWSEQKPEDWFAQSMEGMKELTKDIDRAQVAGIGFGGQMHGLVTLDKDEDDNVGTQALSEGEKAAETTHDISKSRYARKLKKKARMQGKKGAKTAKSSTREPTAAQYL